MDNSQQRLRLQRSFSERPAPLRRSSSFFDLLGRVSWASDKDGNYTSSEEDEAPPPTPPSPVVSMEEAKRARKQKMKRLFKQGVSKVVKERAEEMDGLAKKGSLYVMDAFAGRLHHGMAAMSTKPWYIFAAFRLQISGCWMWTIIASSVAHSLLVFLEPRPGMGPEDGSLSAGTLRALEVLFIAVYATDVGLKVAYMGLKSYVKKPWQKLMIAIVVLLTLDVCGFSNVRFARALRPAILSLRTRSIRRFYAVVGQMLPGFLRVCLPVVFFMLLSASYAALSFGRAERNFQDPGTASYAIWILMVCADNYQGLISDPPAHPAYIPFIVMVIVVGSMFLLSLLLGVTYDVFIEHTTEQVQTERLKELKGLNEAFRTMDPTGTGKLSLVVWNRFLLHLMPRTTEQERALYFEIASRFADNLDVFGFMDLRQVLSYSFVNVNAIERAGNRHKRENMPRWAVRLLDRMEGMLHHNAWKHIVAAAVVLDCLFLPHGIPHQGPALLVTRLTAVFGAVLLLDQALRVGEWVRQGSGPGPLRLPGKGKSFHTKVAGVAVVLHTAVVALLHCPPLLYLTCTCCSFLGNLFSDPNTGVCGLYDEGLGDGGGGEWKGWRLVGSHAGGGRGEEGMCMEVDSCTDRLLMLSFTLRLMRCWRLVTLNDTLHDHVNTFFSVVPVFAQTLSFALIVTFTFAMVAMQAFADKAAAFSNASVSFRTTLQLFVGVDFGAVVEDTVSEVGPWALFFFVAYHVVGVLIVFNLLTAIMIQLYGEALNEKSRQGMDEQRKADQELQDSLYEYNQKRRVLRMWGKRVTEGAARLNITREAQVSNGREARRMLGAVKKSQTPTAEELQQCQKHAKVDLLKTLRERARADYNLLTFERSFYKKLRSEAGPNAFNVESFKDGETIYQRGDQHLTCFFVHKGVVRLEWADGTTETKENGEMFGEEALVASLTMCATAVAEGSVECVGVDRATFTEEHGTLENLGMVFLRLQRAGSLYSVDAPPSDGSREGSRRSNFSASSSRSMRTSTSFSVAAGGSSHLGSLNTLNNDLVLPERWRNRGRTSMSNSRRTNSSFNVSAQPGGGGGGGGEGGDDAISAIDRRMGSSGMGDQESVRRVSDSSAIAATGAASATGAGGGGGGRGTNNGNRGSASGLVREEAAKGASVGGRGGTELRSRPQLSLRSRNLSERIPGNGDGSSSNTTLRGSLVRAAAERPINGSGVSIAAAATAAAEARREERARGGDGSARGSFTPSNGRGRWAGELPLMQGTSVKGLHGRRSDPGQGRRDSGVGNGAYVERLSDLAMPPPLLQLPGSPPLSADGGGGSSGGGDGDRTLVPASSGKGGPTAAAPAPAGASAGAGAATECFGAAAAVTSAALTGRADGARDASSGPNGRKSNPGTRSSPGKGGGGAGGAPLKTGGGGWAFKVFSRGAEPVAVDAQGAGKGTDAQAKEEEEGLVVASVAPASLRSEAFRSRTPSPEISPSAAPSSRNRHMLKGGSLLENTRELPRAGRFGGSEMLPPWNSARRSPALTTAVSAAAAPIKDEER